MGDYPIPRCKTRETTLKEPPKQNLRKNKLKEKLAIPKAKCYETNTHDCKADGDKLLSSVHKCC